MNAYTSLSWRIWSQSDSASGEQQWQAVDGLHDLEQQLYEVRKYEGADAGTSDNLRLAPGWLERLRLDRH